MHVIAAYTDVFMIYEYVLNRVEYRFKGDIKPLDDQEFTGKFFSISLIQKIILLSMKILKKSLVSCQLE